MTGPSKASVTQSLDRAIDILRLIGDRSRTGVRLADLSRASGLAKPTALRLVRALERQGLVERCSVGDTYHLGKDVFVLGLLASERHGIAKIATPFLRHLAEESGDAALLTLRQGRFGVCIQREEGAFPIRSFALRVGDRHPLGVGSNTLAMLSALERDELEPAIAFTSEQVRKYYPTYNEVDFREEVVRTRAIGYALNPGRLLSGSWGMAVSVTDASGHCVAALSIAAVEARMDEGRRPELAELMRREAASLAQALGTA
ncbi:IclR family transcriptional regulator [Sphingobium sp. HWE2-09]|uniref:IclR family transcriptional regulator n=1 Tax=Sphingobium sp. HWE2-09 TaxID=3108390 RepID=UPI002DC3B220|nr:IclR family transcriptional regulator [Sphingobium sp. HWE2-09]